MSTNLHAANAPSHVAGTKTPFSKLNSKPLSHIVGPDGSKRAINLCAGQAALPQEVLERAAREFVNTDGSGTSVCEMGYRTQPFHRIMERAESSFRKLLNIPDTHEVHFFNGGATLQFAAIPLNLMGGENEGKCANYLMSGHWSEKARNEASQFGEVNEVAKDPAGLYFSVPPASEWNTDKDAAYFHYTSADTRQGLEIRDFDFEGLPEGMPLCCDASANLGTFPMDIAKHDVIYSASHKNFSASGICYAIIRKDLISRKNQMKAMPTMCNWVKFQEAPNKIYNVPVLTSVWLGAMVCEYMIEKGGIPYYEALAIKRSNLLYDLIDSSQGFYRTFVTDVKFRSRMQVVFTIGSGTSDSDVALVEEFLREANDDLGWLDIRSHPLGLGHDVIRVTMYNHQPIETITVVRDYMQQFMEKHATAM
ncbi:hypothetical protein TrST_g11391 [Triparma strigata]|uniref:phosphoserine transaminase n=1 Tax=Triparma strigata TaxID=1606541 RepID=A0A9W7AWI7_9STRA|nr:hypothetical protein TrST_g11391 [Triparma strigata]